MFEETTVGCPSCGKTYEVEWPRDADFKCECGEDGYWSNCSEEEYKPVTLFLVKG